MPIGDLPRPSQVSLTFGEPSVPAAVGGPAIQPKNGAGLWGLVAGQAAELDQMKAAGPALTAGVVAQSGTADPAVFGSSTTGNGVRGTSTSAQGVFGHSSTQVGVYGESESFDGVYGFTKNPNAAGVSGHNPNGLAGYFEGNLTVTGDVILPGADCAEQFDVASADSIEPGTVMSICDDGSLDVSRVPYDRRVAGVVSGAGRYRSAIILDQQQTNSPRASIALIGKVFCKVDATFGSIETGDLLTTSHTPGHAMKATDAHAAFGAIIGKAMQPLKNGRGMVPILIALQ